MSGDNFSPDVLQLEGAISEAVVFVVETWTKEMRLLAERYEGEARQGSPIPWWLINCGGDN